MTTRIAPDPEVVRRHNDLFDLYDNWPGNGDPDDDPEFVAQAREIMGLPPLAAEVQASAEDIPDESEDFDNPDEEQRARALARLTEVDEGGPDAVEAAAGHDVTPGHEQLHHYWTRGKGLAKWVTSPTPWTTLFHHLVKYMSEGMAKRAASKWFIEVFGYAAGSDKNRVAHGKPPRGRLVGPG